MTTPCPYCNANGGGSIQADCHMCRGTGFVEDHPPGRRRPVDIVWTGMQVMVLADDGTIWAYDANTTAWQRIPDIPGESEA